MVFFIRFVNPSIHFNWDICWSFGKSKQWLMRGLHIDVNLRLSFPRRQRSLHLKFCSSLGNNFFWRPQCSHPRCSSVHTITDNVDTQSGDTTITPRPQERTLSCRCICSRVFSWQRFYLAIPALLGIWKMTTKKASELWPWDSWYHLNPGRSLEQTRTCRYAVCSSLLLRTDKPNFLFPFHSLSISFFVFFLSRSDSPLGNLPRPSVLK